MIVRFLSSRPPDHAAYTGWYIFENENSTDWVDAPFDSKEEAELIVNFRPVK
jgi:hypothetical protein